MPPPVRRTPPAAIREAWTAAGIGRTALMTAGVAAASGAFLAFVGAFGLSAFPLGIRLAYLVPVAIVTGMIGLGGCLLATRLAPRSNRWFSGAAGGVPPLRLARVTASSVARTDNPSATMRAASSSWSSGPASSDKSARACPADSTPAATRR